MPSDVYDHLELRANRCRLVLLSDAASLIKSNIADKLLSYGSIKDISLTLDSRAAFIEFACEHAPLLVARCYVYQKTNPAVPMPHGTTMLLPGCSVKNFLYCCVPPGLTTLALKRFFTVTSGLDVTVHRPGPTAQRGAFKRAVVEFHGAPPVGILDRAGEQPVPFTIHVHSDVYIVYAVPYIPALADFSGLIDSDGCEDCNLAVLRPLMEEEDKGLTQQQRESLLPPALQAAAGGPPVGSRTPVSSPRLPQAAQPPPQRDPPVRINMPQQRAPRFPAPPPREERWDDVPDPAPPAPINTRMEEKKKKDSSPFISAETNVFLAPNLPRLTDEELARKPRKLHAIEEERETEEEEQEKGTAGEDEVEQIDPGNPVPARPEEPAVVPIEIDADDYAPPVKDDGRGRRALEKMKEQIDQEPVLPARSQSSLSSGEPRWDDIVQSSTPLPREPTPSSPAPTRDEKEGSRDEQGLCHIMPTIAPPSPRRRPSGQQQTTSPSKRRQEERRRRERRAETEQGDDHSSSTMTTSVPGLVGAPMETFDAAAMRRQFERGGAREAPDAYDLEAEEMREMNKRLAREGWPLTYTSDDERHDEQRRRARKQRELDYMKEVLDKERAEKEEGGGRGKKQRGTTSINFSSIFPSKGAARGSGPSSGATSVETSPSTVEAQRKEARRARREARQNSSHRPSADHSEGVRAVGNADRGGEQRGADAAVDEQRLPEDDVVEESKHSSREDDVIVEKTSEAGEAGGAREMKGSDATTQSSRATSPLSDDEKRRRRGCGDQATTAGIDEESERAATTASSPTTTRTTPCDSSTTTSSEEEERDSDDLLSGEEDKKWRSAGPSSLSGLSHASTMDSLWSAAAEAGGAARRRIITPEEEEEIRQMVRGLAEAAIAMAEAKSSPPPSPTVSLVHEDTESSTACEEPCDESEPGESEDDTQAEEDDVSHTSSDDGTLRLHYGSGSTSDEGTVSDASEDTVVGDAEGFFDDPDEWDEADKAKYGVLEGGQTGGLSTIEEVEEESQEEKEGEADLTQSSTLSGSSAAVDQEGQSTVDTASDGNCSLQ